MAEIINLRAVRKAKARTAAQSLADQNRIRHGSTKATRDKVRIEAERLARHLDGKRRDPD